VVPTGIGGKSAVIAMRQAFSFAALNFLASVRNL
jgi:hypothetical protein